MAFPLTRLKHYASAVKHALRTPESREARPDDRALSTRVVPVALDGGDTAGWRRLTAQHPDPDGREWLQLSACPVCAHPDATLANRWNKLLMLDEAPDAESARYDYSVCHACGILYARRRPFGARYRFLLEHFGDVAGKPDRHRQPHLYPYALDETDRERLRALAGKGVFVSSHTLSGRETHLPALFRDRFQHAGHADIIGSLIAPRGARTLEVRSKFGSLLDILRRTWGAEVFAMPMFESQRLLIEEVYGIPTSDLIDFDDFSIPFDGPFDLVIAQHMLTHVIHPQRLFAELRRVLAPGGHLYLYNEPDDHEFLTRNQSMIATLNPLHFQAFDQRSLARGLAAHGFEVVFIKSHDAQHLCLARRTDTVSFEPLGQRALERRLEQYRAAYAHAILALDERYRPRVAEEWDDVVKTAVASGMAGFDKKGRLRLARRAPVE